MQESNFSPMVLIRLCYLVVGLASLSWGASVFGSCWSQSKLDRVAEQILRGHKFKMGPLVDLVPALEEVRQNPHSRPSALYSVAVIQLRMVEESFTADERAFLDVRMKQLQADIHRALAYSPDNAFLWLALFWSRNTQSGFTSEHLRDLAMSYQTGPNEGWIAVRRNRAAVLIHAQLPADLKEQANKEFARLVDSSFLRAAVDILTGPGWQNREALLAQLKAVPEHKREIFAKVVHNNGYDVVVPGVIQPDPRPWRQ